MDQFGDLDHIALEQAAGIGVGDHDRGHIRSELGGQIGNIDPAIGGLGDLFDLIADKRCRGGIGAVG